MRPLGDLVDILDGRRIPVSATERAARPGSIPYFGAAGQVGWIDRPIFNEELVLLGEDGVQFFDPIRPKAYRISGPAWVNNHAHVLRARPAMDWKYLEHFLNWFDYRGFANGTTRLKLTQAAMRRIEVRLPSLPEQRRIVDILEDHLSRLDAAEHLVGEAIGRLPGVAESALRSVSLLGDVPRVRLRALLSQPLSNGRSVQTLQGGFPVLRLTALQDDRVNLQARKPGAWNRETALPFLVARNDIFVGRGNGSLRLVGRASRVMDEPDEVAYPDTMIRIRLDEETVDAAFFTAIWNSRSVRRQIEGAARTTAGIYKVNQSQLESIELPVPELDAQRAIGMWLTRVRSDMGLASREAERVMRRATSLRRALLAAAFSGRLTGSSSDLDRAEEMASA